MGNASDCTITVKKGRKVWFSSKYIYNVTIELSDIYDFEKFDKEKRGVIITIINNWFGYYPMVEWGLLKSYNWKIKYEFDYKY